MENSKIAVGLDIGTTKIVAMIGRRNENGKIETLGVGKSPSRGVHRGVVNNISLTIDSIKRAVELAEMNVDYKIRDVVVGVAGQHIRSMQHSDYINRENPDDIIGQEDVEKLIMQVHNLVMLPGEEIIHVLPQEYKIDGQGGITEPIGMHGSRFEANFHVVIGQTASIRNIARCIKDAGFKLQNVTLEPIASADAVLAEDEKEAGVALVDIGGGTTDLAIFKDNIIRHTAVVPFGGNSITEDIKVSCSIIEKQAEVLKRKFGSAWPDENRDNEIVSIPGLRGREPKEISIKALSKVIYARMFEIVQQIHQEIKNYGNDESKKKLIAGIVITGGGAEMRHLKPLFNVVTGMDCRIGYPNEHLASSFDKSLKSPIYATSVGLVMKGLDYLEKQEEDEHDDPIEPQDATPDDVQKDPPSLPSDEQQDEQEAAQPDEQENEAPNLRDSNEERELEKAEDEAKDSSEKKKKPFDWLYNWYKKLEKSLEKLEQQI